jgi:hypothetical protein
VLLDDPPAGPVATICRKGFAPGVENTTLPIETNIWLEWPNTIVDGWSAEIGLLIEHDVQLASMLSGLLLSSGYVISQPKILVPGSPVSNAVELMFETLRSDPPVKVKPSSAASAVLPPSAMVKSGVIETFHTKLPDWTPAGVTFSEGAANNGDTIAHKSAAHPIVLVSISGPFTIIRRN